MPDDDACYLLASWAKQITVVILQICRDGRKLPSSARCTAGQIATWLKTVSPYIDSLPRYWVEPELEQLCLELLKKLAKLCVWPDRLHVSSAFAVRDCHQRLIGSTAKGRDAMTKSIHAYFSDPGNKEAIKDLAEDCRKLYEELAPTSAEQASGPPPLTQRFAQKDQAHLNEVLYKTLQRHCECYPNRHGVPSMDLRWHPTRLCLERGMGDAFFDIMISSMDMSSWQEFRLSLLPSSDGLADAEDVAQGHFCSLLEQQLFARIAFLFKPDVGLCQLPEPQVQELFPAAGRGESLASILRNYQLTPRDKVVLAYAVARAYWQFYDSELMRTKWSSETIHFMPAIDDAGETAQLPLKAFVSFPFGVLSEPLEDAIHDIKIPLNHRCPRVFALGVLLLEIGLAAPFPTRPFQNQVSQVNFDHKTAKNQLKALRAAKWLGFSHMQYFVDAAEYCIEGSNFASDMTDSTMRKTASQDLATKVLAGRRRNLFNYVVRPLAWLAETGFNKSSTGVSYIKRMAVPSPTCPTPASGMCPTQQNENVAFHSAPTLSPSRWLEQLKAISAHVDARRSENRVTDPVRVAILDTGFSPGMEYYQDEDDGPRRLRQVVQWRDFVDPANESTKVDDFGHGTLMARLVAESAPFAELLVARVAKSTKTLPKCQDNIAEAILWAGEQGADIISMSFGFPREHAGIGAAIQKVTSREGGAVFLASAGNSPYEDESFPARHAGVISVYATNRNGTFSETNARRTDTNVLGTFGDDIPTDLCEEFERAFPGVCRPGSSVATAVAAGIGAVMLAYGDVLPQLSPSRDGRETRRVMRRMRESRGMAAVFRVMAQDMSEGRWFVNPARFWSRKNKDEPRYHAIADCLWEIDRGLEM